MKAKRFIAFALMAVAALLIPVAPSSAGGTSRTVTLDYAFPVFGTSVQPPTSACVTTDSDCPLVERPMKGERYLTVSIVDESGTPTSGVIEQKAHHHGAGEVFVPFCGETDAPVMISPKHKVKVYVYALGNPDCPSAGTTGTVELTFSTSS